MRRTRRFLENDKKKYPLQTTIASNFPGMLMGKPTADDLKALPKVVKAAQAGQGSAREVLRQALSTVAGRRFLITVGQRLQSSGTNLGAAFGQSWATGQPLTSEEILVSLLVSAGLPRPNRVGRFVNNVGAHAVKPVETTIGKGGKAAAKGYGTAVEAGRTVKKNTLTKAGEIRTAVNENAELARTAVQKKADQTRTAVEASVEQSSKEEAEEKIKLGKDKAAEIQKATRESVARKQKQIDAGVHRTQAALRLAQMTRNLGHRPTFRPSVPAANSAPGFEVTGSTLITGTPSGSPINPPAALIPPSKPAPSAEAPQKMAPTKTNPNQSGKGSGKKTKTSYYSGNPELSDQLRRALIVAEILRQQRSA
ncbi:MAG: hypothetical protein QM758_06825 [Armatimonas sp.]